MPKDEPSSVLENGKTTTNGEKQEGINPNSAVILDGQRTGQGVKGTLKIHGRELPIPSFILEVASWEDFETIIRNCRLLKDPHAVAVPAYHWIPYSQSVPTVVDDELNAESRELVTRNHIITYEPPEFYRYSMPQKLLTHAMRGDEIRAKRFFNLALVEERKEEALNLLPPFERGFIEVSWDLLMWQHYSQMKRLKKKSLKYIKNVPKKPEESTQPELGWSNVSESYLDHVANGLVECQEMNTSSSFIPAVRTLKVGSDKAAREQVKKSNKATAFVWKEVLDGPAFPGGRPWYHLSMDRRIFTQNIHVDTGPDDVIGIVNESLDSSAHCGVCVTMTGWQYAWREGKPRKRLESFFGELCDIAFLKKIPVYAARSKWFGIDLMDLGVTFAGTIMNGNEIIPRSSGGIDANSPAAFGNVPIYGKCIEADVTAVFEVNTEWGKFKKPIELHKFEGIESRCDPAFQYNAESYRRGFAKPRRIATHTQEAREIGEAMSVGIFRPGREYIKRSKLWEIEEDRAKKRSKDSTSKNEIEQ